MRDERYAQIRTERGFADGFGRDFPTDDEAHASFVERINFAEQVAGRSVSRRELFHGVAHPEPDRDTTIASTERRKQELAGPPLVQPTVAEMQLQRAQERLEASLPAPEQRLREAQRQVDAERAEKLRQESLANLLAAPKAKKTLETINHLVKLAMYDSSVDQDDIDELRHQKTLLLKFGDASAAAANVKRIQDKLLNVQRQRAIAARQHADRAADRAKAIMAGQLSFDSEPVVLTSLYGEKTVILKFAGETVEIPFHKYDGRPPETLLRHHFGIGGSQDV